MDELELTGRTRFRSHKRLFGKPLLVVQVEEAYWVYDPCDRSGFCQRVRKWRDAQPEDLLNHHEVLKDGPAMARSAIEADTGRGFPGTTF